MKLHLNLRVDEEMVQRLKEIKRKRGISITFQLEQAVREYLEREEVKDATRMV